jgi:hypothetical protein
MVSGMVKYTEELGFPKVSYWAGMSRDRKTVFT